MGGTYITGWCIFDDPSYMQGINATKSKCTSTGGTWSVDSNNQFKCTCGQYRPTLNTSTGECTGTIAAETDCTSTGGQWNCDATFTQCTCRCPSDKQLVNGKCEWTTSFATACTERGGLLDDKTNPTSCSLGNNMWYLMTKNICTKLGGDEFYANSHEKCVFTNRSSLMAAPNLKNNCTSTGGKWASYSGTGYCNCPIKTTVLSPTTGKCVSNTDATDQKWRDLCINELSGIFNSKINTCTLINNKEIDLEDKGIIITGIDNVGTCPDANGSYIAWSTLGYPTGWNAKSCVLNTYNDTKTFSDNIHKELCESKGGVFTSEGCHIASFSAYYPNGNFITKENCKGIWGTYKGESTCLFETFETLLSYKSIWDADACRVSGGRVNGVGGTVYKCDCNGDGKYEDYISENRNPRTGECELDQATIDKWETACKASSDYSSLYISGLNIGCTYRSNTLMTDSECAALGGKLLWYTSYCSCINYDDVAEEEWLSTCDDIGGELYDRGNAHGLVCNIPTAGITREECESIDLTPNDGYTAGNCGISDNSSNYCTITNYDILLGLANGQDIKQTNCEITGGTWTNNACTCGKYKPTLDTATGECTGVSAAETACKNSTSNGTWKCENNFTSCECQCNNGKELNTTTGECVWNDALLSRMKTACNKVNGYYEKTDATIRCGIYGSTNEGLNAAVCKEKNGVWWATTECNFYYPEYVEAITLPISTDCTDSGREWYCEEDCYCK